MKKTNFIQKYFLLVSTHPIAINVIIWAIMIIVPAIFQERGLNTIANSIFLWTTGGVIFHMIIIYWVRKKYITMNRDFYFEPSAWAYGFVPKEGEGKLFIMKKFIWEKGERYEIQKPNFGPFAPNSLISVKIVIQGKHKNTLMSLKGKIIFASDSEPDQLKIFEELLKNKKQNSSSLSINAYVLDIFRKFNHLEKYDEIVKDYSEGKISETKLLQRIIDTTEFPERIFSFEKGIRMEFGNPTFSACKGFGCMTET